MAEISQEMDLPPIAGKSPRLAKPVIAVMLLNIDHPYELNELCDMLEEKYYTVRPAVQWLQSRGYVKRVGYRSNAALYQTTIKTMLQYEYITQRKIDDIDILSDAVLERIDNSINGEPLSHWLKGYASKAGRNANAKAQTDVLPFIIGELYRIALKAKGGKPWAIQAKLSDLEERLDHVIATFQKLLSIADQLKSNLILWDSRYIHHLIEKEPITISHADIEECIAAVRANYGVPDASYE